MIQTSKLYGVCIKTENNSIYVANTGIVDVNVKGIVCIGDNLTASDKLGKARAIKYELDKTQFGTRSIGKVIGLYNIYNKARVLLNIK